MKPDKIVKTFMEERDCGAALTLPAHNTLKLKTVNNGVGNYVVIETARWAVSENDLGELFKTISEMLKEVN